MPQEYNISNGTNPLFKTSFDNEIPLNIPNVLQNIVSPLIRVPHPTLTQIALDNAPIYRIAPIANDKTFDDKMLTSRLGTGIMDAVTLIIKGIDIGREDNEYHFIYSDTLIQITQAKNIVTTEIAGNNGTVKEFIGLGDYAITISGRLTASYGIKPAEEMIDLFKNLKVNKTIGLSSKHLLDLNITNMVVTSFDLPQVEGEYSTQYFTINGISDAMPENKFIKFVE